MTEKDKTGLGDEELDKELAAEAEGADDTKKTVEEKTEETDDDSEESEEGEESEDDAGKFEDTDKPQIPVRNASFIIQRQKHTIEKLRNKKDTEESDEADDEEQEEEDVETETPKTTDVASEVSRQLKPITERMAREAEESDLADLFKADPEAKGYERAIRAFMKHPAWAQVPPVAIYAYLSREHTLAMGAKMKRVADVEAAQTRGTGSQRRSTKTKKSTGDFPTAEEIDEMSDEELDAMAHKVQTGQFKK